MVILPVLIPFEALVKWLARLAFVQSLPDPQAAQGRMQLTLLLFETTDPALPWIVFAVPAEDMMHLVNETQGKIPVCIVTRPLEEFEIIAHRKRIRP
jgi:hypothetical protein